MRYTVGDIQLHCEVRGTGRPVLMVHGFPLSGRMWDGVVAELEGEFRCIVPDLRGHGASGVSERASMARYADDLAALLDALGEPGSVAVVGLSMGGYIALEMLRSHPRRVGALALVDTRAGPDAPAAAAARLETAERVLREGSGVVADAMVDRLFAPDAPAALKQRWRDVMAATPPRGIAAALRAMAARPDSLPDLARATCPVLLLVGEHDVITPPEEARRMQQAAPAARLVVVPAAGHMAPVERPGETAAALRDLLR